MAGAKKTNINVNDVEKILAERFSGISVKPDAYVSTVAL
jgi:hypothetical protein